MESLNYRVKRVERLRWMFLPLVVLVLLTQGAVPVAASGPNIVGGGMTDTMTRFGLAIHNGTGHFECLMPAMMTVEATVTSASLSGSGTATFSGTAVITMGEDNPFGLPAGPSPFGRVPFSASVTAGGPGVGFEELIFPTLGMKFPGTVEHGQIRIES
jgi:hypothetical protein